MKLTLFLICFSLGISYAADSYGQIARLSLNVRNVSLQHVLDEIETQSEFSFFYNNKQVDIERLVTLKKQNSDIFAILDELFAGTGVSYNVLDRSIILSSRGSDLFRSGVTVVQQSAKRIAGTIINEQGEPLAGANVVEKGTVNGNISDENGQFTLTVSANAVMQVSYIGYLTQEVRVEGQTNLQIILREDSRMLEEVVVLGYGTTMKRADLSAAVGIVKNVEVLKQRPVSGVAEMLQGQIPGVTVQMNSGSPSDGISVTIRGQGSRASESPLWVVDGVPGAPLNPNDVESIVVLKDAASAAIYGAQSGASGVILVTTKQAKAGKPNISYEGTFGFSQATRLPQSLLIEEQRALRER